MARQNGDEGRFSVYVHSAPGFELDRTATGSSYFYGRQLAKSVKVSWCLTFDVGIDTVALVEFWA